MKNSILLGGGCFWCLEAVYQKLPGVTQVTSGYAGGQLVDPTYQQVCSGQSGHAEVVAINWQPKQLALETLLTVFFEVHDPTSLNRQGNDIGTQYRSFIGLSDTDQRLLVENTIKTQQAKLANPIVTEIQLNPIFYPAEASHQSYYRQHQSQPYCQLTIKPKLDKLLKLAQARENDLEGGDTPS